MINQSSNPWTSAIKANCMLPELGSIYFSLTNLQQHKSLFTYDIRKIYWLHLAAEVNKVSPSWMGPATRGPEL